jgi:hypothetical protein
VLVYSQSKMSLFERFIRFIIYSIGEIVRGMMTTELGKQRDRVAEDNWTIWAG